MSEASRRSRNNRAKGHQFERDISNELKGVGYPEARRQLEYHASDAKGVDIQNTGRYKVQCKNTKKYIPPRTLKDIECDRVLGEIPLLVSKSQEGETVAILYWKDLKRMIKEINSGKKK